MFLQFALYSHIVFVVVKYTKTFTSDFPRGIFSAGKRSLGDEEEFQRGSFVREEEDCNLCNLPIVYIQDLSLRKRGMFNTECVLGQEL